MKNFIFKSTEADLQKMFSNLAIIQKNTLYCTYRIDAILKKVNELATDKGLQKQVDEYFTEDETSPQTDSEKHDSNSRDLD